MMKFSKYVTKAAKRSSRQRMKNRNPRFNSYKQQWARDEHSLGLKLRNSYLKGSLNVVKEGKDE